MSATSEQEAALALALARAFSAATSEAAGRETRLVSITCDLVGDPSSAGALTPAVTITRATRTLVFAEADLRDAAGACVMAAAAVYRVV